MGFTSWAAARNEGARLALTLDQEHIHLNLLFCGLESQIMQGAPVADQLASLKILENFLRANCATEEAIMAECCFPLSKDHKEEHRSHYGALEDISRKIGLSSGKQAAAALMALHQELLSHIRDKDQEVADWKRRQVEDLLH